jgi:putative pyruvate formate lyase activating enzyme
VLPSYLDLLESGELRKRALIARELLKSCACCPRLCKVDRTKEEYGICGSLELPILSSYTPHFGEEPVLSGTGGAGNLFFGNCNLGCVYCQNFEISQNRKKERENEISCEDLAHKMLELQEKGCHNIGLVSPTHFSAQIIDAIYIAASKGLRLPLIYNSNGYDSVEMLKLYNGIIDIYLPDFKYGDNRYAKIYSGAGDYFERAKEAVKEMFLQVGSRLVYDKGVVIKGLIIRHLVLPNGLSEPENIFRFIAEELSPEIHISLMSQYYPAHKAPDHILISRPVRESEYFKAVGLLDKYGLYNGWTQELVSGNIYRPSFSGDRLNPFK